MRRQALALTLATAAAALTACGPTGSGADAAPAAAAVTASDAAALPEPVNVVTAPPETGTPTTPAPETATPTPSASVGPTPAPSASTARPSATAKASATASAKAATATTAAPTKPAAGGGPIAIGYNATADSPAAVDAAVRQAKSDGKNVLLDFGATWCGNCKALDKTLGDSQVQSVLNASYHLVQVDIGGHSTTNFNLLKKYDSQGSYKMPVLIVVTPDGTVRTDTNTAGLPSLNTSGFTSFLKKWAP
ncbi:thioredoxin family protein [Kitasatospora sp. NPDC090091]|uniref:thioredoxin family protein n=1 Tax=Kitasatospora sp. NPDC090091 TaxID=3364081 RepID=UPI0038309E09